MIKLETMASGKGVLLLWLLLLALREMILLSLVCYHLLRMLIGTHVLPGITTEHLLLL